MVAGFRKGDFAVYAANGVWQVVALPAQLVLGRLPSASAVRRFAAKCISFPAQPNGAVNGAARQAMLQAVEERSEEHTSELQSLMRISYAVFCLKKKKNTHQYTTKTSS